MGAQDNTEKVLRSLHVMLSKSEPYGKEPSKVIVDKQQMLDLLKELNKCMVAMMEEYELTKQSRDNAEREFRKRGDEIVWDASRKAEDIYAASVMYTDEALNNIQTIMQKANDSVDEIYREMGAKLKEQKQIVRANQSELKSQLQDLADTEKYLKLIEERNRQIAKQKKEGKPEEKEESSIYANRQTEIKINQEYFEKMGIPLDEEDDEDDPDMEMISTDDVFSKKNTKVQPEVKVNLDSEYFKRKEQNEAPEIPMDDELGPVYNSIDEIPEIQSEGNKGVVIPAELTKVIKSLVSGKK